MPQDSQTRESRKAQHARAKFIRLRSKRHARPDAKTGTRRVAQGRPKRSTTKSHSAPDMSAIAPPVRPDARSIPPDEKAQWVAKLCQHIEAGGSLLSFCKANPSGPDRSTFNDWMVRDATIAECIQTAREHCADAMAEQAIEIADETEGEIEMAAVSAAKLRIDIRRWAASKLKPGRYGDRLETVATVTVQHVISDDDRARALAQIMARAAIAGAPTLADATRLIEAQAVEVTAEAMQPAVGSGSDQPG